MKILLFDRNYQLLGWASKRKAIKLILKGKVTFMPAGKFTMRGGVSADKSQSEIELGEVLIVDTQKKHKYHSIPVSSEAIFCRDKHICAYCGTDFKKNRKVLTVDHIVPKRMRGDNSWKNLITACRKCNNIKDDRLPGHRGAPKLLFQPYTPTEVQYLLMLNQDMTEKQREFLKTFYPD